MYRVFVHSTSNALITPLWNVKGNRTHSWFIFTPHSPRSRSRAQPAARYPSPESRRAAVQWKPPLMSLRAACTGRFVLAEKIEGAGLNTKSNVSSVFPQDWVQRGSCAGHNCCAWQVDPLSGLSLVLLRYQPCFPLTSILRSCCFFARFRVLAGGVFFESCANGSGHAPPKEQKSEGAHSCESHNPNVLDLVFVYGPRS